MFDNGLRFIPRVRVVSRCCTTVRSDVTYQTFLSDAHTNISPFFLIIHKHRGDSRPRHSGRRWERPATKNQRESATERMRLDERTGKLYFTFQRPKGSGVSFSFSHLSKEITARRPPPCAVHTCLTTHQTCLTTHQRTILWGNTVCKREARPAPRA